MTTHDTDFSGGPPGDVRIPYMHETDTATHGEDYRDYENRPPSIYRLIHVLSGYRITIALGILAVMIGYGLLAAIQVLRAPSQRMLTLPFRLSFQGADLGLYPNGLKFSGGDIVATPIVTTAYNRNRLDRFVSLRSFTQSLVVLEENAALERLTAEYRARLADARLNPVDRERLTAEYQQKSASLDKTEWSLVLTMPEGSGGIPTTVGNKVMHDILSLWAEDTAVMRRALQYRVPMITANIFAEDPLQDELVISIVWLRARINDVIFNIRRMGTLPGAELARTERSNVSLAELELLLSEMLRMEVEPLIARAIQAGTMRNPSATLSTLLAQREFDLRQLQQATRRTEILRAALNDYASDQPPQRTAEDSESPTKGIPAGKGSDVIPQLDQTFLDRLVQMATDSTDREYRRRAADEIRNASLDTLPLYAAVAFDEQLIALAKSSPGSRTDPQTQAALQSRFDSARKRTLQAVSDINELHRLLSRNLQPSAQLYTVTGPVSSTTERTMSLSRIALGGLITFLVAIPLLCAAALLHARFVREEEEEHDRELAAHAET